MIEKVVASVTKEVADMAIEVAKKEAMELPEKIGKLSEMEFLPDRIDIIPERVLLEKPFSVDNNHGKLKEETDKVLTDYSNSLEDDAEKCYSTYDGSSYQTHRKGTEYDSWESKVIPDLDQVEDEHFQHSGLEAIKEYWNSFFKNEVSGKSSELDEVEKIDSDLEEEDKKVNLVEEDDVKEDDSLEKKGGSYGEIFKEGEGDKYEVHHMPADSTTELERNDGPAIKMEKEDHRQTASCGSSREAREYRAKQKELIDQGKFREALQMDIDDIHDKFGDKYDDAISEMLEYVDKLEEEGKIDG